MDGVDAAEGGVSPVVPGLHGAGSLPPGRGDICCASTWSANLAKARHVCEELSGGSCTITETFFYTDGARCKLWYFCRKTGESGHVCDFDHTVSEARPECDRGRAEPPDLDPPREDGGGTSLIFDDGVYPCPWEPLEAVHDGCPEGEGSTYGCCTPVDVSDSPRVDLVSADPDIVVVEAWRRAGGVGGTWEVWPLQIDRTGAAATLTMGEGHLCGPRIGEIPTGTPFTVVLRPLDGAGNYGTPMTVELLWTGDPATSTVRTLGSGPFLRP